MSIAWESNQAQNDIIVIVHFRSYNFLSASLIMISQHVPLLNVCHSTHAPFLRCFLCRVAFVQVRRRCSIFSRKRDSHQFPTQESKSYRVSEQRHTSHHFLWWTLYMRHYCQRCALPLQSLVKHLFYFRWLSILGNDLFAQRIDSFLICLFQILFILRIPCAVALGCRSVDVRTLM